MENYRFITAEGTDFPAVTESQMRDVDRITVAQFGFAILQMMENAGRNLASMAMRMLPPNDVKIVIMAGSGGNGGGGICSARHLLNRGYDVKLFLSKDAQLLSGAGASQLNILTNAGFHPSDHPQAEEAIRGADLVIDALIGYSLKGAPRGRVSQLITAANNLAEATLALDIPSGIDSSTGETPGVFLRAGRTMTLALPKIGLSNEASGELFVSQIGIPPQVYQQLNIPMPPSFQDKFIMPLKRQSV